MLLAGVLTLGCAATAPRDWKRIDGDGQFSFDAPAGVRLPGNGIDTFWMDYAARGLRIHCLYGVYTPCSQREGEPTTVSGHPASIRIEKSAKRDTLPYRGALCVPVGPSMVLGVFVGGRSKEQVLRVLRSVSIP